MKYKSDFSKRKKKWVPCGTIALLSCHIHHVADFRFTFAISPIYLQLELCVFSDHTAGSILIIALYKTCIFMPNLMNTLKRWDQQISKLKKNSLPYGHLYASTHANLILKLRICKLPWTMSSTKRNFLCEVCQMHFHFLSTASNVEDIFPPPGPGITKRCEFNFQLE